MHAVTYSSRDLENIIFSLFNFFCILQGIEKKTTKLPSSEKAVVARHEAGHAVVGTAVANLLSYQPRVEVLAPKCIDSLFLVGYIQLIVMSSGLGPCEGFLCHSSLASTYRLFLTKDFTTLLFFSLFPLLRNFIKREVVFLHLLGV